MESQDRDWIGGNGRWPCNSHPLEPPIERGASHGNLIYNEKPRKGKRQKAKGKRQKAKGKRQKAITNLNCLLRVGREMAESYFGTELGQLQGNLKTKGRRWIYVP
jgi:hypothetical protein